MSNRFHARCWMNRPRQLSWQSRGLKILVSLVRFRFWALLINCMRCTQHQLLYIYAGVVQWQNTSLPSWIRGFDSHHPLLYGKPYFTYKRASGSVGGARPCQGRGRGFESRLALSNFLEITRFQGFFLYHRVQVSKGVKMKFNCHNVQIICIYLRIMTTRNFDTSIMTCERTVTTEYR